MRCSIERAFRGFWVLLLLIVVVFSGLSQYGQVNDLKESNRELIDTISRLTVEMESMQENLETSQSNAIVLQEEIKQLQDTNLELSDECKRLKEEIKEVKRQKEKSVTRGSKLGGNKGKLIGSFKSTAYCPCSICNGKWTGLPTKLGTDYSSSRTIAVDPEVIPLGTKVYVEGFGVKVAEDTGSAIKKNIIDIYYDTHQEAKKHGAKQVNIYTVE